MRKAVGAAHAMPVQQISVNPVEWVKDKGQEPMPPERCMSQASTLSNSYDICRICHCEGEGEAPLIAPCYCSGSLRYVHQACLQQWIKSSDIRACELCKFQFIMYSKMKPITQWEQLELTALERRRVLCSVLCQLMGLTCVLWSLYVLIDRTLEEISRGLLEWPLWTKLIVVTIGFTGSVTFWYFQAKYYCALCRRWRAFNRVIYVENAPEKMALDRQGQAPTQAQAPESGSVPLPVPLPVPVPLPCCGTDTHLHHGPASSAIYRDDVSVVWLHELRALGEGEGEGEAARDCSSGSDAALELLPPPAAFVDSSTNTELVYENEKARARARDGSGAAAEAKVSGTSPSPSSYLLGSSLTYGHGHGHGHIGYPYMLSTFHAIIPPNFRVRENSGSGSGSGSGSSLSSSDQSVTSLVPVPVPVPEQQEIGTGARPHLGDKDKPSEPVGADAGVEAGVGADVQPLLARRVLLQPYPKT